MRFNGSAAWNEAMRLVSANKEVLAIIAGVFVFLPAAVAAYFMGGAQRAMMAQMMQSGAFGLHPAGADPAAQMQVLRAVTGNLAQMLPWVFLLALVEVVGQLAMLALLTDSGRPTVGEALAMAVKALPTMIGVMLLLLVGYFVFALAIGLAIGALVAVLALLHLQIVGAILAIVLFLTVFALLITRLSMILPVAVMEGVRNPVAVITGSWSLVKGNTRRLFLFFVLLTLAYFVIALVIGGIVAMVMGAMVASGSAAFLLGNGIVSGLLSAAITTVMVGLLAAIHRQLAGSTAAIADTFS